MHRARRTVVRDIRVQAVLVACLIAVGLGTATVTLHAMGGDYNGNPTYCHNSSPIDPLWWWFECWKPDPPADPM